MSESAVTPLAAPLSTGRRLAALAALGSVWLTTAGHSASFREMNAARGWVATDGYALHSSYLFAVACGLALTWANRPMSRPVLVMRWGLSLLVIGSFLNGLLIQAPYAFLAVSRMAAGFGAGMVLAAAPVAGQAAGSRWFTWAGILLPSIGPPLIAWASDTHREQGWEGSFLFEGLLSVCALIAVITQGEDESQRANQTGYLTVPLWFPVLAIFLLCLWYLAAFGQLKGWGDDPRCAVAFAVGTVALSLLLAMQILTTRNLQALPPAAWPTLIVAAYAGFVQFFNVSDMGIYGGIILDLGQIDRSLLIWPLSIGTASGTILALFLPRTRWLALLGLLSIVVGMGVAHSRTMGWTYWSLLNQTQFNWFAAPGVWELALSRFLMGMGTGLTQIGLQRLALSQPEQEGFRRDMLTWFQFLGGALSIGILTLCTTRLFQTQYSYVADRGAIQSDAYQAYGQTLGEFLRERGFADPEAGSRAMLHNGVNYESNNLIFATIYGTFQASAWIAMGFVLFWWLWNFPLWQAKREGAALSRS